MLAPTRSIHGIRLRAISCARIRCPMIVTSRTSRTTSCTTKLVIADDVVVTGSFNFSNHAMGNAENVLLIRDAGMASKYEAYVLQLMAKYRGNKRN